MLPLNWCLSFLRRVCTRCSCTTRLEQNDFAAFDTSEMLDRYILGVEGNPRRMQYYKNRRLCSWNEDVLLGRWLKKQNWTWERHVGLAGSKKEGTVTRRTDKRRNITTRAAMKSRTRTSCTYDPPDNKDSTMPSITLHSVERMAISCCKLSRDPKRTLTV